MLLASSGSISRGLDEIVQTTRSKILLAVTAQPVPARQQTEALESRVRAAEKLKASVHAATAKPLGVSIPPVSRTPQDADTVAGALKSEIERLAHLKSLMSAFSQLCRTETS